MHLYFFNKILYYAICCNHLDLFCLLNNYNLTTNHRSTIIKTNQFLLFGNNYILTYDEKVSKFLII